MELSILHTAFFLEPPAGILRQMEVEQEAANALGLTWRAGVFTGSPSSGSVAVNKHTQYNNRLKSRLSYYRWLFSELKKYDVLVLRYSLSDPLQLPFMMITRKPIVLMHHTLELAQVRSYVGQFRFARSKLLLERVFGYLCLRQADAIVGVTNEIVNHELERISPVTKPTHVYPNGIRDVGVSSASEEERPVDGPVRIIFVASLFIDWHGLDKVIEAVAASDAEFILDVVGLVDDERLLKAIEADSRIQYHGEVFGEALKELTAKATIGLGSFALERKDMYEACTLKVRDYLAMGLPVYSGHRDIFPEEFPYYRFGPCNIESLLEFTSSVNDADRNQVVTTALPFVEKRQLVSELHTFIENTVRTNSSQD